VLFGISEYLDMNPYDMNFSIPPLCLASTEITIHLILEQTVLFTEHIA
jgi:hypothetical protein